MAQVKVAMISSTARDLPEHREVVRNACLRQSIMPSMMEYWPAIDTDGIAASLKKVDEADRAGTVWRNIHGEDHIDTATGVDALSDCYRSLGRNKEALVHAEEALAIRTRVLGRLHPDTANSCSNVGNICARLGDSARALKCEEKALSIVDELFGSRSSLKATVLKNIALAYHGLRDFKKALGFAVEALAMKKELFGDQHPETLVFVVDATAAYCAAGRVLQGFQLIEEYLRKTPKTHVRYEWLKEQNRQFHARYFVPGFRRPRGSRR